MRLRREVRRRLREPREPRGDRGSGAIAVVLFALVVLVLAAFVVDTGMAISQRERAMDFAEQAARYAAQDVDLEALREDGPPAPINFGECDQNIAEYANEIGLSDADVEASYCIPGETQANQVTVRIRVTYEPIFTGMLYNRPLEVWGEATAEAQTG
jgi:Flp pilus assembly protein TadG